MLFYILHHKRYYQYGEIIGFEVEGKTKTNNNKETVETSFNKVGTVTFVKEDTNEFVALGHSSTGDSKNTSGGLCYNVDINGINKSSDNEVGNIIASLNKNDYIGYIDYDSEYGVFGKLNYIKNDYTKIETNPWYNVKKGKASILIALDSGEVRSYDVQITGIDYLSKSRNIKIKVVDNELIRRTGGVVQGMSGAPLVQDGKLIGAINFANTHEPTNAYAIFIDKLL